MSAPGAGVPGADPPLLSPYELWENPEWLGRDVRVGGRVLHGPRGWRIRSAIRDDLGERLRRIESG